MIYVGIILFLLIVGDLALQYYNKWKTKKLSISIKEALEKTGFPLIEVEHNQLQCYFLIDTGANLSQINSDFNDQLSLTMLDYKSTATGVEGVEKEMAWVKFDFKFKKYPMELEMQNAPIPGFKIFYEYQIPVVGILGNDFLQKYGCVISYKDLVIYPNLDSIKNRKK